MHEGGKIQLESIHADADISKMTYLKLGVEDGDVLEAPNLRLLRWVWQT